MKRERELPGVILSLNEYKKKKNTHTKENIQGKKSPRRPRVTYSP